ncbi:MAG: hypothetical protein WD971_02055 [Pirellulales bacterium]
MNTAASKLAGGRWFRFNLRAFFVLITIVACVTAWLGQQVTRRHQEQVAINELTRLNPTGYTTIVFESRFDRRASEELTPLNPPRSIESKGLLSKLRNLNMFRRVAMFSSFPAGNTFKHGQDDLGRLVIEREYTNGLKDAEMRWIGNFRDLKSLWLEANGITDDGLVKLIHLRGLEILWLQNTSVSDKGMAVLASFPALRQLDLSGTLVTDASNEYLRQCTRLTQLNVSNTQVTLEGVTILRAALPNCQIEF